MNERPFDPRLALSCLGHRSRFSLVERLAQGGCCVTELAREVALSQSCTTRHLQALERAGLVAGTRRGKQVVYELRRDAAELGGLLGWALGVQVTPVAPNGRNGPVRAGRGAVRRRAPASDSPPAGTDASSPNHPDATEPPPPKPDLQGRPVNGTEMEDWLL